MVRSKTTANQTLDPFVVEIVRSGLVAITDEMKTNLMRTAYNSIVYEGLDFTVALTDEQGNLISIGLGLPSFIRGISDTVKSMIKFFGTKNIHPGDVLLTNDAYTHGSHLNHVIAALPVFHDGEIVAYTCSEPHWVDIGGLLGRAPNDIFSEGLQIPYVKIYDRGEVDEQILSIISANVRNPSLAMGDFRGQIACVRTGEKRVLHMVDKYGAPTFRRAVEAIMQNSDDFSRNEIRKIPEGTYEAEEFMDDDGVESGKRIPIRVKITVKEDTMEVDLSGVGRQVRGAYNSGAGISGAQMAFKHIVCPTWYPINDGSFRPLKIALPEGTVVSATKPSMMRWWMTIPTTLADTIWKALAPAIPNRITAGHFADLCVPQGFNIDSKTGMPILTRTSIGRFTSNGGGYGAKYNQDGMCATNPIHTGDTHNVPIEVQESADRTALVVRRQLREDSGGPGRFRGGLGVIHEILFLGDWTLTSGVERTTCPPWGAFGGRAGLANCLEVRRPKEGPIFDIKACLKADLNSEHYPNDGQRNAKFWDKTVVSGSRLVVMSGGGGGFGSPSERDPQSVLQDWIDGYISLESAKRDYAVVIDADNKTVDHVATQALRA